MQTYSYTARDNLGRLIRGVINAENENDLSNKLSKLNLYLITAQLRQVPILSRQSFSIKSGPRISKKEVLDFTIQLYTLLEAGIPLLSALRELAKDVKDKKLQKVISEVASKVEAGISLREALSLQPRIFSKMYVSVVGAGETTGKLPFVLKDLAKLLEWQLDLKAKIKEASIYPIILFLAMVGVVAILVIKVIPMFEPMFKELGVTLPLPTAIILQTSRFFSRTWWIILVLGIITFIGFKFAYRNEYLAYFIDRAKLKLPIVGDLLYKVSLSNFCHTFALTLRSGINVLTALSISSEVLGNRYIESSIEKARSSVNVGEKIATSLESCADFPPLVIRMISVGEQTGALSETLDKVNQFYDKEVPTTLKRIFALFEPIMIVTMGLVVGCIALSVFLPLMQIIGSIGE